MFWGRFLRKRMGCGIVAAGAAGGPPYLPSGNLYIKKTKKLTCPPAIRFRESPESLDPECPKRRRPKRESLSKEWRRIENERRLDRARYEGSASIRA